MSRILVTVGTDHHPFQRLVDWADDFARRHREHDVFIQYGTARPPQHGRHAKLLDHAQLQTEIARADVVVCHGGPATITDIRRSGLIPLCVPRDPIRGEHVDHHQIQFAERIAEAGIVTACLNVYDLEEQVKLSLTIGRATVGFRSEVPTGVRKIGELLGALSPSRASSSEQSLPIVYIGGQGRSGTTLLERALGELPGVVSLGETVHLWDRGLRDNELCGCTEPFGSCPFWRSVGDEAFGGWDRIDPEGAAALRFAVDRNRYVPLMTRPGLSPRYQRQQAEHLDRLARLYRAIASVSGARVLIDSSKHASYALLLSQIPGIDLRLLHVVRDSRAVAHAWTRTVPRPEAGGVPMPVYGPAKAAVLWDLQNTLIERLRQQHPYIRVRYEDFVEAPKDILLQIARFAGLPDDPSTLGFLDGDTITVSPSHSVAGNPMRFVSGDITITSDHRWSTEMPAGRRRYVSALTLPLQRRYGYQSGLR